MSHHLDSPLARQDTRLDITDVYLFRGAVGTVFVMNGNSSITSNSYPERFHPEARYEFKVDTDGDAMEDVTFRVTFGSGEADGRQALEVRRLDGSASRDRTAKGVIVAQGRSGDDIVGEGGLRVMGGDRRRAVLHRAHRVGGDPQGGGKRRGRRPDRMEQGQGGQRVRQHTVNSIVIEVPDGALGATTIGFWGVTALATDSGGWRQINRAGHPMIQPIFNPDDGERSSEYNTTRPSEDRALYGPIISKLVSGVVAAMGTSADPQSYGELVAELCFPDILRYEVGTPAVYGFAKRNGRALSDNAPEVMFSIVVNAALSDGLRSSAATGTLRLDFPYVALPVSKDVELERAA